MAGADSKRFGEAGRSPASLSKVVTESPDILPRRRNVAGEALPESGNSGLAAVNEKAEGVRPSAKPLLILTLTEAQLDHLAFAVYCQTTGLEDSEEADSPEVLVAMERLNEVAAMCIELAKAASSPTREELATTGKAAGEATGRKS